MGWTFDKKIMKAKMWAPTVDGAEVRDVGLYVICCGVQADAPMRAQIAKCLGTAAKRGCNLCCLTSLTELRKAPLYLGYSRPCEAQLIDSGSGKHVADAQAWAGGRIHRIEQPVGGPPVLAASALLSPEATKARDLLVEREAEEVTEAFPANGERRLLHGRLDNLYRLRGSRGRSEYAKRVSYWLDSICFPVAAHHTLSLGAGKDYLKWILKRAKPEGEKKLVVPFELPKTALAVLHARRHHFVLRNKPDCIMVDWTKHLSSMSMSEVTLLFEVGVPYLVHDIARHGVPRVAVAMWLLLRHGMLCFTRAERQEDMKVYEERLQHGRAALHAYAAIAQHLHENAPKVEEAVHQFWFTWKLHMAVAHLADQCLAYGHPVQASDAWVERLMRHFASMVVKCAPRRPLR